MNKIFFAAIIAAMFLALPLPVKAMATADGPSAVITIQCGMNNSVLKVNIRPFLFGTETYKIKSGCVVTQVTVQDSYYYAIVKSRILFFDEFAVVKIYRKKGW